MADISSNGVTDWGGLMANAQLARAQGNQAQATTALTQQQTAAAGMQNQITQARLPLILSALSDFKDDTSNSSGVASDKTSPATSGADTQATNTDASGVEKSPEASWYDPAKMDSAARDHYFVPPVLPQEAKMIRAAALSGDQGLLENAKMQRQFRVDQATAASQKDANDHYESLSTVEDAEPGRALAQLAAVAPNAAKRIKDLIPDAADEDAAARAYSSEMAGTIHQYTGRKPVARADGVYVDEVTGRPIPGVQKSGLSTEQWTGIAKTMLEPVTQPDGQGHTITMPRWKFIGAPTLDAAVMQVAAHQGDHGSQPTVGGVPKLVAKQGAVAGISSAQKGSKTPADGVVVKNPDGTPDTDASDMLSDAKYKYTAPRAPYGATLSDNDQQLIKQQSDAANDLKKDASEGSRNLQQSQMFYKAAQDILDTKGASTGKWSSVMAKAGQWLPGNWGTANYQELAKLLGNAALQAGKSTFSHMTDHATEATLHELNPSPEMDEKAVKNMITLGTNVSQYGLDSARLIPAYLKAGGDATQFYTALAEHKPIDKYVSPKAAAPAAKPAAAPAAAAPKYSDAQIAKYAKTYNMTVDAAKAHLGVK